MADDRADHPEPAPDSGRAKRAPPTIDLEANDVSPTTETADANAEPEPGTPSPPRAHVASAFIAAVSGAAAAALVIAAAWFLGWPNAPPNAPAAPQVNAATPDDLAARVAKLESEANKPQPSVSDPAVSGRIETLDKSLAKLRAELDGLRAEQTKLVADVNDGKSAPRGEPAAPPDLTPINERIAGLERAVRAQASDLAQDINKPADDMALRRLVAASLLDNYVRNGEPYAAALATAKSLTDTPDTLKPLDQFAATGVPNAAALSRELLAQISKLSPPSPGNSAANPGILDRLQAGAAKLVRIERTDSTGTDRAAIVARATAAAVRNNYAEARRELKTLPPAEREAAQAWIEKADARDAALAASRQFAADAMTALAKPR